MRFLRYISEPAPTVATAAAEAAIRVSEEGAGVVWLGVFSGFCVCSGGSLGVAVGVVASVLYSYFAPFPLSCEMVVYDTGLTKSGLTILVGN